MKLVTVISFFHVLFGSLILVVSATSNENAVISEFIKQLEGFFYSELSAYIAEKDHLLPLLDFPDSLSHTLKEMDSINCNDLVNITSHNFKAKCSDNDIRDADSLHFININLKRFCLMFERSHKPLLSEEEQNDFVEVDHLIFALNIDFESHYSTNVKQYSELKLVINSEKKWQNLLDVFQAIQRESWQFLNECKHRGCFKLFADLSFLTNHLISSLMKFENRKKLFAFDDAIFFFGISYDSYSTIRSQELAKLPKELRGFILDFFKIIEDFWLKCMDDIEALDKEIETDEIGWNVMADRIFKCSEVFRNGPLVPPKVLESALKIIQSVQIFCSKYQEKKNPFNPKKLAVFITQSFDPFFETFLTDCQDENVIKTLYLLKNEISSTFDDIPEFSDSTEPSVPDGKKEIEPILSKFLQISERLPLSWREAQLFSEFDEYSQLFKNEILFFRDGIKMDARMCGFNSYNGEQFILDLIDLLQNRMKFIRLPTIHLEIFQGFIDDFYNRQFFSQLAINSNSQFVFKEPKEPVLIDSKELLDNPSLILNHVAEDPDLKGEGVKQVIKVYSDFIDEEFKGVKDSSHLKSIISQTISNSI